MPELPEVETICRGLAPSILKQKIAAVVIRHFKLRHPIPKNLPKILTGQSIQKITRRGKYILIKFLTTPGVWTPGLSKGGELRLSPLGNPPIALSRGKPREINLKAKIGTLIIHLGMSGNLQIKPKNHLIAKHEHVNIVFTNNLSLCYIDPRRFGTILWTAENPLEHRLLKNLGPEPFAKNFTADYLFNTAKSRHCSIKQFIMNSNIVAGIGNIYANEALFAAKINPLQKANKISLSRYQKLVKEIKKILKHAIKHGGTTIKNHIDSSGKKGSFQNKLKVYGKYNQLCPNCKTKLTHTKLGQRATVFCSNCQK